MKKILLSLLALVAFVAANAQTEVKFDFDANFETYFSDLPGVSSGSNDTYVSAGELNHDYTITNGDVTVVVKASAADAKTRNRVWASSPRLRLYNESFTISAAEGHKITKIEFTIASTDNFNVTPSAGKLVETLWGGEASSLEFAVAKNTQIKVVNVTLDGPVEEPQEVHIQNTPETAYTVAKAHEIITAGKALSEKVYVKGIISRVESIDTGSYGNATYYISDDGTATNELEVYRGYSLGGDKFKSEEEIQDGDEVVVYGLLVDFKGTHEFTTGSQIYSLNGKQKEEEPIEPIEIKGDGSIANPYTAEEVAYLYITETAPTDKIWVKGTILGNANTSTGALLVRESAETAVDTNISFGDETHNIPVQLPQGDVRAAINIKDNFGNVGKTVWLYGVITKYCSTGGLKEVSDFSWDGQEKLSDGISSIKATNDSTSATYNLNGQRVAANTKGIVIVNGLKYINK